METNSVWQKELAPIKEFKLGLLADEASSDLEEAATLAGYYGATGLEIRTAFGKQLNELTSKDINHIKEILKNHNMTCCGIGSPFFKCKPEEADSHLELLDSYIHVAKELGTNRIRGFAFWRSEEHSLEETMPIIKEKLTEAAFKLRKANMTLLLENEPSTYDTDAAAIVKIIKDVNLPEIQALWDPGNDIYTYTREIPFPNGYNLIRPWIQHIHIKDAKRNENDKPISVCFGNGVVDYVNQFNCLSKEGYTGWLVLEPHYRAPAPNPDIQQKHPCGIVLSNGGLRSTAECFEQLLLFLKSQGYSVKKQHETQPTLPDSK